jgi:hypothetical protein
MPAIQSSPVSATNGSGFPAPARAFALKPPPWYQGLLQSPAFFALLVFITLNCWSAYSNWGNPSPLSFPEKGWTGWAIEDFLKQETAPDLVF